MQKTKSGFTIVELLIVIVVIAILAAISIVAYNGIQQRARDAERAQDIATIQKVLEMYYIDNGTFPYTEELQDPTWRKANLATQDQGIFINPQDTRNIENSINASGSTVGIDRYSYYSIIDSSGTTCRLPLNNGPCTGYRMAWVLEAAPSTVQSKSIQK